MCAVQILAIGRNKEILETVVRLINANDEWCGTGVQTDAEAINAVNSCSYDLILLTNGIDPDSEMLLKNHFRDCQPDAIVIQHYGGGSGLLSNEIMHALQFKNS